jgi:hypothetical protein
MTIDEPSPLVTIQSDGQQAASFRPSHDVGSSDRLSESVAVGVPA